MQEESEAAYLSIATEAMQHEAAVVQDGWVIWLYLQHLVCGRRGSVKVLTCVKWMRLRVIRWRKDEH
eukprot:2326440-Pyramimonas_sp.AAC.1